MADVEMSMDLQDTAPGYTTMAAQAEYTKYVNMDESRHRFINSLIQYLDECTNKIQRLEDNIKTLNEKSAKDEFKLSQYNIEAKSHLAKCRTFEKEVSKLKAEYNDLLDSMNDDYIEDPFVAVVVDGDGAIFTDQLLKDPILAADKLKEAVRAQLREMPSLPAGIPIVVRIYANLHGLARTVNANEIISHAQMLEFASKFTFECDYFDFVDVGESKEAADSKIRTIFNHYYTNKQCRRIFLAGISHDNGYLNVLKEVKDDQGDRITLVESYPARSEFKRFGLPIKSFPGVFRTEMLPSPGALKPRTQSLPQAPPLPSLQSVQQDNHVAGPVRNDGGSPVDRNSPTPLNDSVQELLHDERRRKVMYNHNHVRLDPILKHPGGPSEPHQISFAKKRQGGKFCNDHYLGGWCKRGPSCTLNHDIELDDREKDILRWLVWAKFRCFKGGACRDFHCYMPHHCPYPKWQCRGDCHHSVHLEGSGDDRKPKYLLIEGHESEVELDD